MITSLTHTEELIRHVVDSPALLIVVACCNHHCRRYWFAELAERLPEGTLKFYAQCKLVRPDARVIIIFLDCDLESRLRGLHDYELVRD